MSDAGDGGEDEIELTLNPDDLLDDDEHHAADKDQQCHINKVKNVGLSDTKNADITKPSPSPGAETNAKSIADKVGTTPLNSKTAKAPPVTNAYQTASDAAKISQVPAKPATVKKVPARITAPSSSPGRTAPPIDSKNVATAPVVNQAPKDVSSTPTPGTGPKMLSDTDMVRAESQEIGIQIWANCRALTEFGQLLSPSEQLIPFAISVCQNLRELNDKMLNLR